VAQFLFASTLDLPDFHMSDAGKFPFFKIFFLLFSINQFIILFLSSENNTSLGSIQLLYVTPFQK
jgi:uncharacterized membrane protein